MESPDWRENRKETIAVNVGGYGLDRTVPERLCEEEMGELQLQDWDVMGPGGHLPRIQAPVSLVLCLYTGDDIERLSPT